MDIERITKDFEELRAELRMSIGKYEDVQKSKRVYQHIAKVASDNKFKEIQLNDLVCYVGGYIFIDPETKEVIPLFGSNKRTQGKPAYPLSYVWSNNKINNQEPFDAFMDNIFISWRTNESIRTDDLKAFRPEYLYHLPNAADTIYPNFAKHPVERDFNETTGCLYCPMGEVAFYVYAWRFFARTVWLCNGDINKTDQFITLDESFNTPESIPESMWDSTLWSTSLIREKEWSNMRMKGVSETESYFNEKIGNLQEMYPYVSSPWEKDWNAMLLIEKKGKQEYTPGGLLLPLLEFSSFLAGLRKHPQSNIIKSFIESIKANPISISINKLKEIDKSLRVFIIDYFSSELNDTKIDANKLLERLHSIVRFPVIAYYYWNYFDETPRTHMVIPVWSSNIDTISLPYKGEMQSKTSGWDYFKTGILGVSVIGTKPFDEFDWTINDKEYNIRSIRLALCRQYYELFSQYIVDDWLFYRRKIIEYKGITELAADYGHRMTTPISDMHDEIDELNDIIKEQNIFDSYTEQIFNNIYDRIKELKYYKNSFKDLIPNPSKVAISVLSVIEGLFKNYEETYKIKCKLQNHCLFRPRFYIDEYLINSIFYELLYNAYRHNKDETSILSIYCDLSIVNGNTNNLIINRKGLDRYSNIVRILFFNTGKSIPKDKIDFVFERGITTKDGGGGYGLFRVRKIIENELGGIIKVSNTNNGVKFTVEFTLTKQNII